MDQRTSHAAPLLPLAFWLLAGPIAACTTDLAAGDSLGTVRGHIFSQVAVPASGADLSVAAFSSMPPASSPNALVTVTVSSIPASGIPYELRGLPAYQYHVVAEMVSAATGASLGEGAYPDYCALSETTGPVAVAEEDTAAAVDVVLYGRHGTADPCFGTATQACPFAGRGSIELVLSSEALATEDDAVVIGLFASWPATGAPAAFQIVPGPQVEFPLTVVDNNVVPGSYALYACLDRGADDMRGQCGDEDVWAVASEGQLVPFMADHVTRVALDLDSAATSYDEPRDAAEVGCDG
jgi:hypothetical protein